MNLLELTKEYIDAFDRKDIDHLSALFSESFTLEDPVVIRLEGRNKALKAIEDIYNSCNTLSFSAKNIFCFENTSIIEFTLKLDDKVLTGADIIEWKDSKMVALRAYVNMPNEG